MSASIQYLCAKTNFEQVSAAIPITKQRNPEKFDPPEIFEANKAELVADLVSKAKQIQVLIKSLPVPESEESQAMRLQCLEEEMQEANEEYIAALNRASEYHFPFTSAINEARGLMQPIFKRTYMLKYLKYFEKC